MDTSPRSSGAGHHQLVTNTNLLPLGTFPRRPGYQMRRFRGDRRGEGPVPAIESISYDRDDYLGADPYPTATSPLSISSFGSSRLYRTTTNDSTPRRPTSQGALSYASTRRTSSNASSTYHHTYSLYPAPTKPLPPLPHKAQRSSTSIGRSPSQVSSGSSHLSSRQSDGSPSNSFPAMNPTFSFNPPESAATAQYPMPPDTLHGRQSPREGPFDLDFKSMIVSDDKRINNSVHFLDVSSTSSTLASKHGNSHVKLWSLETGDVESVIKVSSYTEAQSRSRDYLIKSHAIVSETSKMIAIATRFGRSIEIFNWEKRKSLQTLDNADRWAVAKMEMYDHGWGRLATYKGEADTINLYAATREKKPFVKMRSIKLADANLPFVPQYPELALSATSPLLIAAAGPRPPRQGHPPPDKETLLVAWEIHDNVVGSKPYRVARPWQHKEIDTAIPCDLVTYGSVVVSIWIPATFRAVRGVNAYNLKPVQVTHRYVLVWDLAANSTRTFAIPNCTSCISPDCRYVAYCHGNGALIGGRGTVAVIDVMSSDEVWCWPDRDATAQNSGPRPGYKQFDDLARVNELAFSADSKSLIMADSDGRMGVYDIHERRADQ